MPEASSRQSWEPSGLGTLILFLLSEVPDAEAMVSVQEYKTTTDAFWEQKKF